MSDICFHTLSAHLITRHRLGPRTRPGVQVRARAWLAAVLKLDPGLEWAQATVPGMGYRQLRTKRGWLLLFMTGQG